MPIRDKIKKAFGRTPSTADVSTSSSPTTLVPVISTASKKSRKERKQEQKAAKEEEEKAKHPPHVYAPGERMPPPKYRGLVDKKHKDRLEAFTFGASWRRKSTQSQYSPMGSRLPSRVGSYASNGGKRKGSRLFAGEADGDVGTGLSRRQTRETPVEEEEGLEASKTITQGRGAAGGEAAMAMDGDGLAASRTLTNGHVTGVRDERVPAAEDVSAAWDSVRT